MVTNKLPLLSRTASSIVRTLRESSLFLQSVKFFNALPRKLEI